MKNILTKKIKSQVIVIISDGEDHSDNTVDAAEEQNHMA
jgi:hypothetical protein